MSQNVFLFDPCEVRKQGAVSTGGLNVGSGAYDSLLGTRAIVTTVVGGESVEQTYMLVEADLAADNFDARGKLFKWGTRADFKVVPCSANADKIAGIAPYRHPQYPADGTAGAAGISSLDDEDYFWICVGADRVEVIHSDFFATDPLEGTTKFFMVADDDADLGKVAGTASFVSGSTVGRYVAGTAADNAVMTVSLRASSAV
jgi:hypothetical protein